MAFLVSPGVLVTEKDLTNIVPNVATTAGGFVGFFQWGPVSEIRTVTNEKELVATFGKPNADVAAHFFTAANFLAYGNNLQVVRVVGSGALNAGSTTGVAELIPNESAFLTNVVESAFLAKYPGVLGNALTVHVADSTGFTGWTLESIFDGAPSANEYHIAVVDTTGAISGTAGTVLEKFAYVSTVAGTKKADGTLNYFKDVLNRNSAYVWAGTGTITLTAGRLADALEGGADGAYTTDAPIVTGVSLFADAEQVDVSLLMAGPAADTDVPNALLSLADSRKDCVVFVSPLLSDVTGNAGQEATDIVTYRNTLSPLSTSYGVMDSGWKYQYDAYNDVYRWVPLNGDIAGLCARTDFIADPWFSPGGFNRGQLKNVVKLAYNPNQADRDKLYKNGVNPCVSFPGTGTVLYGDKTLQTKPSAFDRINVRRLFIVLEKAVATAAKYQLFEFNDAFTRAQFRNMVEPFLRNVQGRRGITDFRVVCDETNNPGDIVDRNEFVADIYIKPARSINFIQLNFIATRTGVSFSEIAGQ